ncbi:uncharacterized protein LOC125000160 [Mugil cephalus]|uniref:uncharacterized protein LOC125000160 n=1 Tax=Mugil cephalus TaxID=48193 RepID=UPI001FB575CE|nr:uncharacterized protein LOC125000160 [Mugil cephalus]
MKSLHYSFVFFILVHHTISLGSCDDISFSLCWMSKDNAIERQNGNIWLNVTALVSIRKLGKVTTLTVSPGIENKLRLQYGGSVQSWTFTISPRTKLTKIRGQQKPVKLPTNTTKAFLDLLTPTEVFACENGTIFFHQDDNFFLALGHSTRLPVKLESRRPTTLLVSWVPNLPDVFSTHSVTLYHVELDSYNTHSTDTTSHSHYRFSALESCSPYVACVEIADTQSFTCIATITDPDIPKDFDVISWNTSSISLAWDCPLNRKYSLFLLTTFFLNGTDHVIKEVALWQKQENFVFSLSDLQPCTRVKFGLQTVCQAGMESRYSKMVMNEGNSVHSTIKALRQTSFGPHNYTLSWEVKNISSISMFRVYNDEVLQNTTLVTEYTVGGLQPCTSYQAKVEALCGDGVLMSAKTVTAQTEPGGVSDLRYRSNDSTALWTPSISQQVAVAFIYVLSMETGAPVQSSRVYTPELHLGGLENGETYLLDVWEECDGQWESAPSNLWFTAANSSSELHPRAAEHAEDHEILLDFDMGLTIVVPWSLPEDLQDDESEARAKMVQIYINKLQELLEGFDQPVRIDSVNFEPANEPDKTEVLFMSFDASKGKEDVPLSVKDQLDYISSLNTTDFTVKDGVIYWDGPDLCASDPTLCPRNSLCINTLGSYSCVCQDGFYDTSPFTQRPVASHPVCKESGLFSQCLDKLMTGTIAKSYLTSRIGGEVELKLNDGRCVVNETEFLYYFSTSRKSSECGTERQVNDTHIKYQNTLTVTLTKEHTISRRDLKVVWKCIYPRHYVRNAQVRVDMEWLSSVSLVEFNSSLQLGLTMTLFEDESYTNSYRDSIEMGLEDTLFFQVDLQTNGSFASDVVLQVESCWSTESSDPQDTVQGVLLQHSCPVDKTFQWLPVSGLAQRSRFSIQMFTMPKGLSLYFHCLVNICGHDEDCTKNCTSQERTRRSVSKLDRGRKRAGVVSAGPLVVNTRKSVKPSNWTEHMTVISIVAGSVGLLGVTMLSVSATKAIMAYYEQLRQK